MNKNCRFGILENMSRTCFVYYVLSMTSTFRLNRFPKGCDADHSNYVSIFINQVSGPPVWVKYAISLLESQSLHRSPFVHNTRRGSVQFVVDRRSSSRGTCFSGFTFISVSCHFSRRKYFFREIATFSSRLSSFNEFFYH